MQNNPRSSRSALLTVAQMKAADEYATRQGIASFTLMQNAGRAVASVVEQYCEKRPVVVLAGPGNNGGDGFIAAQELLTKGWQVTVAALMPVESLKGDALTAAESYTGKVLPLSVTLLQGNPIIVDALFGTGINKPVAGAAAEVFSELGRRRLEVVAVDIPSGVNGNTGEVLGVAAQATHTVTFFRKKIGHMLMPGHALCGRVHIADIGISDAALPSESLIHQNTHSLWLDALIWPKQAQHKYHRGHLVVVGGEAHFSGASRLSARSALRAGAGLVTVVCGSESLLAYASQLTAVMCQTADNIDELKAILSDARINTVLIGPGAGVSNYTRHKILALLAAKRATVLDADAISAFAENPTMLFNAIHSPVVMTPHEGEFRRLFSSSVDMAKDKLTRARQAASIAGCVVVLKGADTVIASPDGHAIINGNAPPYLATAGSGDVLAGIIAGLMAQGVPAFEAAAAGVWMHGAAASEFGPGLIAEDLTELLPGVLNYLLTQHKIIQENTNG